MEVLFLSWYTLDNRNLVLVLPWAQIKYHLSSVVLVLPWAQIKYHLSFFVMAVKF